MARDCHRGSPRTRSQARIPLKPQPSIRSPRSDGGREGPRAREQARARAREAEPRALAARNVGTWRNADLAGFWPRLRLPEGRLLSGDPGASGVGGMSGLCPQQPWGACAMPMCAEGRPAPCTGHHKELGGHGPRHSAESGPCASGPLPSTMFGLRSLLRQERWPQWAASLYHLP